MLKIKIHRGTHSIGGSITEIYTENTHIFIDFGSELNPDPEDSTDPAMINMINTSKCDAVLFTHYHGDHIGLINHIPEKDVDGKIIKLAMGKVARQVLINIHECLAGYNGDTLEHSNYLATLRDKNRSVNIEDNKPIFFGDIKVTPINVDHSAIDAYMFIVEAEGKVIVHTGDFRTHGRLGEDFFDRLQGVFADRKVGVLITEGTMMSRGMENVLTEKEIYDKAFEIMNKAENKYAFLICSSTNVESLASFSQAAFKLGRAFYVNSYVYKQIELYSKTIGEDYRQREELHSDVWDKFTFMFPKTYEFEKMNDYNPRLGKSQPEYMADNGFLMLIGSSDAYKKRIDYFKEYSPLLIYSMWSGYIDRNSGAYDEKMGTLFNEWEEGRKTILHTSGHATSKDISQMIETVKPKQAIIPIHTEKPEAFRMLDIDKKYTDIVENGIVDGWEMEVK